MSRRRRSWWASPSAGLGLLVVAAGCGSSKPPLPAGAPATTTSTSTSLPPPTVGSTTTTTVAAGPLDPLTDLPEPSAAAVNRSALVVKIDNVDQARPQTGINQADVVYEEMVEGGLTRLAAVFQSQLPDPVGPIRSGRTTDEGIIDDLNDPVFAYSGANTDFLAALGEQPVVNVNGDNGGQLFFRAGPNEAPHNLFADATALAAQARPGQGAPPALFAYRGPGQEPAAAGTPVARATLDFPATTATWTYQAGSHGWLRDQDGTPDVDVKGQQVSVANVVIESIPYVTALTEADGTPIPEGEQVGSGTVWVLSDGSLVQGTWSRSALTSVATLTDSSGRPILLTPGRTWVELLPSDLTPTFTP